jgi:hypothetical protein
VSTIDAEVSGESVADGAAGLFPAPKVKVPRVDQLPGDPIVIDEAVAVDVVLHLQKVLIVSHFVRWDLVAEAGGLCICNAPDGRRGGSGCAALDSEQLD